MPFHSQAVLNTAPASVVPTISSVTAAPVNSNSVINGWGIYVYSKSQAKLTLTGAAGKYGSTIVTKSISRFGRNTVDTLTVLRQLKAASVDVYFETENIHSLDSEGELLITLASAIAQAESEERSKNIKWGIRQSATKPDSAIYSRPCYGYRKDSAGQLIIQEEEADVVRLVYDLYLSGESVVAIIRSLKLLQVETPRGKDTWSKRAIETMLKNEKYTGDVLVYKTYCDEYPKKKRIVNKGRLSGLRLRTIMMQLFRKKPLKPSRKK